LESEKAEKVVDTVEVYGLLKNPIRREILTLLYTRGEMTASQLKLLLNISYGTLYYHLDYLKPFINQVGRGRYVLNEKGFLVTEKMLRELGEKPKIREEKNIFRILSMATFMEKITLKPTRYMPLGIIVLLTCIVLSQIMPIKFTILHLSITLSESYLTNSIISFFIVIGYVLLAGEILSPHKGGFIGLISGTLLSYTPVALYITILFILKLYNYLISEFVNILQIVFIIVHALQIIMISSALTHSRGISWEKSLPATLILSYISLLAIYYNIL